MRAGLLTYIRLLRGTVTVSSLDGCRAATPEQLDGLTNQPLPKIRVGGRGGDRFCLSGGLSCYALLGRSSRSY